MIRLLSLTLGMVLVLIGLAQLVGEHHPFPGGNETAVHVADARPETGATAPTEQMLAADAHTIARGPDGQFHLTAQVNGADTRFLIDTGADVVALTVDEADRLGIYVDPASFQPILRTASGTGYGAQVHLDRLVIDGQELDDIDAVVVQGLDTNLLGQSVLRRLGRVELRGDRLVIEPA